MRPDSFQNNGYILYLEDGGGSNHIELHNIGATRRARWYIRNGETDKDFTTPAYDDDGDASLAFFPPAGQWAHVAAERRPVWARVAPHGVI